MTNTATVGESGERETLARILARLGGARAARLGPGDDCAVLDAPDELVITTDTMIEGPDFRLAWHAPFELGWKLAATNLSDVAAMGARPTALTVALACPRDTPVGVLEELAAGLDAACRALAPGSGVVGGDLANAPVLMAAVTALGDLEGRAPVTRSGAVPGDIVAYAGDLGLAGMGLSLLFEQAAEPDGTAHGRTLPGLWTAHPEALAAQLAPAPPVSAGIAAAEAGATAMLDVSDSLSLDAARISRASGVAIRLDRALLEEAYGRQGGEDVPVDAMLAGGEDQGLLATFPRGTALPEPFHRIGEVRSSAGTAVELTLDDEPVEPRGWDPYTVRLPGL